MDYRSKLVAFACVLACAGGAQAYAVVSPPAGVSMVDGVLSYIAGAGDTAFATGIRTKIAGSLAVGGRAIAVPVAFEWASTVGGVMAKALSLNPAWLLAGLAAPYLIDWIADHFTWDGTQWIQKTTGLVSTYTDTMACTGTDALSVGKCAIANNNGVAQSTLSGCVIVSEAATSAAVRCTYVNGNGLVTGLLKSSVTSSSTNPVTAKQMEDFMTPRPWPLELPKLMPLPLPVKTPILNPSPATVPLPQPLRVPLGDPQAIPGTDPVQYRSPAVDIVPSPTVTEPWRVDVQPKDVITTSPTPLPETAPVPAPTASEPAANPSASSDLCLLHPEIIACQTFKPDTLTPDVVTNDTKNISISPDSGWGPSTGSCPAPHVIHVQGLELSMSMSMMCDFATAIRPLFIGLAWISSILLMLGLGKKG
jgi:hypothetical protein